MQRAVRRVDRNSQKAPRSSWFSLQEPKPFVPLPMITAKLRMLTRNVPDLDEYSRAWTCQKEAVVISAGYRMAENDKTWIAGYYRGEAPHVLPPLDQKWQPLSKQNWLKTTFALSLLVCDSIWRPRKKSSFSKAVKKSLLIIPSLPVGVEQKYSG